MLFRSVIWPDARSSSALYGPIRGQAVRYMARFAVRQCVFGTRCSQHAGCHLSVRSFDVTNRMVQQLLSFTGLHAKTALIPPFSFASCSVAHQETAMHARQGNTPCTPHTRSMISSLLCHACIKNTRGHARGRLCVCMGAGITASDSFVWSSTVPSCSNILGKELLVLVCFIVLLGTVLASGPPPILPGLRSIICVCVCLCPKAELACA